MLGNGKGKLMEEFLLRPEEIKPKEHYWDAEIIIAVLLALLLGFCIVTIAEEYWIPETPGIVSKYETTTPQPLGPVSKEPPKRKEQKRVHRLYGLTW